MLNTLGSLASIISLLLSPIKRMLKRVFKKEKDKSMCQSNNPTDDKVENTNPLINNIVVDEKENISSIKSRIEYVLRCMNHKIAMASDHIMNKEIATDLLELKSVKEFDTLSDDGDINFVKNFANSFGINYDWLLSGKDAPFESKYKHYELINNIIYKEFKINEQYKYIIAMNEKANSREIILIQKIGKHKYEYDPAILDFYDTKSGGGRGRLTMAYNVLKKIKVNQYQYVSGRNDIFTERQLSYSRIWENSHYDWLDTVCVVDEDMFYKLQSGDIYPGSLLEYRDSRYNYLINSFVDLSDENIKECVNDKLLYDAMTYLKSVFK